MKLLELKPSDRLLLGILLPMGLLATLLVWLAFPPKKGDILLRRPSTFFNAAYGTKVAYLVLDRLGVPVTRLRRPIAPEKLEELAALVVLRPTEAMHKEEVRALSEWVREGHYLVVAPATWPSAGGQGGWLPDSWFNVSRPPMSADDPEGRVVAGIGQGLDSSEPLLAGIRQLASRAEYRFPTSSVLKGSLAGSPVSEFWKDDFGVVAVRVEYGAGQIIALADTYPLSNLGVSDADNGLLLANLARELTRGDPDATPPLRKGGPGGVIAFDEFHLGFPLRDYSWLAITKLMLREHWGWGIVQGALVGVLALYGAGVRFGRPRDVFVRPRRHHREFAEAAGGMLHDARATELAYRTLYQHYRSRLCGRLHLSPDVEDGVLRQAIAQQSGRDSGGILEEAAEKLHSGRITRLEVLDMADQMHRAMESLEHGT